MGLANSLALRLAGISNYTMDPDGGAVMRNTLGGMRIYFYNQLLNM